MRRSNRQRTLFLLSIIFGVAPFAFALIRAHSSRNDFRMLWMALASVLVVAPVMLAGKVWRRQPAGVLALAALALVAATFVAGWVAYRLGATAAAGIWPVSFVLAFCWATSFALNALSRRDGAM
jgi:hypothetical protein